MDLIWVGSLVTHLSADLFVNFLNFFHRSLRPGGVFIFTTHGRRAYDWTRRGQYRYGLDDEQTAMVMDDYERLGFGYSHYTGSQTYGQTLSRPDWVYRQLARIDELRIAAFLEAGWNNHQDVFVCVRDPQWKVVHPHAFL
jgi:SAM-dependent methyltransferase